MDSNIIVYYYIATTLTYIFMLIMYDIVSLQIDYAFEHVIITHGYVEVMDSGMMSVH